MEAGGLRRMSELAYCTNDEEARVVVSDAQQDYIPLILEAMHRRNVGLRALALQTRICKSRLGLLLHRDAAKRSSMNLSEFHTILSALKIDPIQAIISVETLKDDELRNSARYASLIPMLCDMFHDLPANLIQALEEVEGMDGTEVRPEWAAVLQRAVIKRVVHEISAVASRRAAIEFSIFS